MPQFTLKALLGLMALVGTWCLVWCRNNGYALTGPNWEIYGHWKDEWNSDPAKIATDVFYLLDADRNPAN